MQTSFVHNWRWSFVVLVATVLIMSGFSCNGDRERQTATSGDDASVAASVPTTWTTYRSDNLGVSIPYPEGWYVEEGETGVEFHGAPPPTTATEYPAQMWYERRSGSIADQLRDLEILSNERVARSGITMQRVVFREDFYTPSEVPLYIWERDGFVYELGGPASEVVERAVTALSQE